MHSSKRKWMKKSICDELCSLREAAVDAAYLGGDQPKDLIIDSIEQGTLRMLYITPEAYQTGPEFIERIRKCYFIVFFKDHFWGIRDLLVADVGLLAVDEAHCISQWGHEFRPGYRQIANLRSVLEDVPVMALTATATDPVRNDIIQNLRLKNPKVTLSNFDR